jgi:hypothetical protein
MPVSFNLPVGSLRLIHPTHISPKEGEIWGTRFGG